jgi:hypothetical protein
MGVMQNKNKKVVFSMERLIEISVTWNKSGPDAVPSFL